jgi:hypothetical protein
MYKPATELRPEYDSRTTYADDKNVQSKANAQPQVHLENYPPKLSGIWSLDPALPTVHMKCL